LSEIATALGNVPTGKMDATVQTELNDAVAAAENVTSASTIDELNSVSTALTEAIANAKSSVADYAAIKTYIEKANNIDASIAENYKVQYDNGNITETAKALKLGRTTLYRKLERNEE
jgi:transcriptional regulator of acetoin/glycerol metabolism